jgi:hypothetical protein
MDHEPNTTCATFAAATTTQQGRRQWGEHVGHCQECRLDLDYFTPKETPNV